MNSKDYKEHSKGTFNLQHLPGGIKYLLSFKKRKKEKFQRTNATVKRKWVHPKWHRLRLSDDYSTLLHLSIASLAAIFFKMPWSLMRIAKCCKEKKNTANQKRKNLQWIYLGHREQFLAKGWKHYWNIQQNYARYKAESEISIMTAVVACKRLLDYHFLFSKQ